jgi:diguanylate cyclase (GGDEF)-like protein
VAKPPGRPAAQTATGPVVVLLAGALYGAAGLVTLGLAAYTGLAAPLWPAAGIAFALVYQRGRSVALGVLAGSFVVNATTLSGSEFGTPEILLTAGLIGIGAALQALLGAALVTRRLGTHVSLSHAGQISLFLVLAGPVACLVNSTMGVAAQLLTGVIEPGEALVGWATWWAGDSMGVMVFAPLTLMLLPGQQDVWQGRRWKVAAPSVAVTLILLVGFVSNRDLESRRVDLREQQIAAAAAADLQSAVEVHAEVLRGIGGLFDASDYVDPAEFRAFTRTALERHPSMEAVSWDAYVPRSELASFLAAQRAQPGLETYSITEKDANGDIRPAGDRRTYVPVVYIEPFESNRAALGFDLLSNPQRGSTVREAIATGQLTATPPLELVQDDGTQQGMLLLLPSFGVPAPATAQERRARIVGFSVGVYRLEDLVSETFAGPTWEGSQVVLRDVTDAAAPVEIGRHDADLRAGAGDPRTVTFDVFSRSWQLEVTTATEVFDDVRTSYIPLLLLGAVLVVGLLEVFLLLVTGLERQARREAESSTYEAEHDPLTELHNRRGFRRALHLARERTVEEGQEHFLMYIDLDGFKAVNDRGGHDAGDALLQLVAAAMQRQVRRRDVVARIGGDEFAVILHDCGVERGLVLARQLLDAIDEVSVRSGEHDLSVTASIGAVPITGPEPPHADELVTMADRACYAAKQAGGGVLLEAAPAAGA